MRGVVAAGLLGLGVGSDAGGQGFGTVTMDAAMNLNGAGSNVDSIAFWEADDPSETLMFVTGKGNDRVEAWKYPFEGSEQAAVLFPANVNGVAVDQEADLLYVTDRIVSVFSVPELVLQGTFGRGTIGVGENNLDLLRHANGETWIYVSDDHNVYRYEAVGQTLLGSFAPPVSSIETVLADDFYQVVYVAEEQGPEGNPGVYAYHPDGTDFDKAGTNRFGNDGEFDSDEEGMLLYTFPAHGRGDDGTGFIVVSDQRADVTDYEFFDRQTWEHLGVLRLAGVSNTDGIASTQLALPDYPLGVFAAIDDDTSTAVVGWDAVFAAIGWDLAPEAVSIRGTVEGDGSVVFEVVFSEVVTGFDAAADVVVTHAGTSGGGVVIEGSGSTYTVRVAGIGGAGTVSLAVVTGGGVVDGSAKGLAASVTGVVGVGTVYEAWAVARGLVPGENAGAGGDPEGDGRKNLEEFATDDDPLSGVDSGKMRESLQRIGEADYLALTLPVRDGAVFSGAGPVVGVVDGIVYSVSGSGDLASFDKGVVEVVPAVAAGLPVLGAGWSYRTFRTVGAVGDAAAGFVRLGVAVEAE